MFRRWLQPVLDAQAVWADPFGDLVQRLFRALYGPFPGLRDLLHGTWCIGVGLLGMVAAMLAGYADYVDLEGAGKRFGSLHSTSMLVALVLYVVSLGARLGWWPLFAGGAEWTAGVGLLFVVVGGYLGGELLLHPGL